MSLSNILRFGISEPAPARDIVSILKEKWPDVQKICEVSGVVGVSVSVLDQGETVFQHNFGYRHLASQEPVTSDTIFSVASLTKSFTGTCIHQLRKGGLLELEDTIHKHLDNVRNQCVTIADILGHRTGLSKLEHMWLGSNGEILMEKDQTIRLFNQAQQGASPRSRFIYNNLAYAVLGELISQVSHHSYHSYLKDRLLEPLKMTQTLISPDNSQTLQDQALAYSVLDNLQPYNVPIPPNTASGAMGSAGGLWSSANDLSKYYGAMIQEWHRKYGKESNDSLQTTRTGLFDEEISWLFAPLQIMQTPAIREKSYASGLARSQLPTTVGDLGANRGLVDAMPILAEGNDSRLAIWHQGSLVGTTSFVMLLPETRSAVIVLTNTMAPNDAADWIGQLLVQILLSSPVQHDYVNLAAVSVRRTYQKYADLGTEIEHNRATGGPKRPLLDYIGTYVGVEGLFKIKVAEGKNGLNVLFQGRESQKFEMKFHHDDTFTWFMTWNEQIKNAHFIHYTASLFFISFEANEASEITALKWAHDGKVSDTAYFTKESN